MKYVAMWLMVGGLLVGMGCEMEAKRIDPDGPETIVTVGDLDIQDATDAAARMSQSLLEAGILGAGGEPSTIAISRYVNQTSKHIDRDEVIKKIRVTLNKAGVAMTYTTIDPAGELGGEDPIAVKAARERGETITPDYSLTFKLLELRAQADKVKQVTYMFQMSLTEVSTGLAVWEEEERITKQGTKNAVGW